MLSSGSCPHKLRQQPLIQPHNTITIHVWAQQVKIWPPKLCRQPLVQPYTIAIHLLAQQVKIWPPALFEQALIQPHTIAIHLLAQQVKIWPSKLCRKQPFIQPHTITMQVLAQLVKILVAKAVATPFSPPDASIIDSDRGHRLLGRGVLLWSNKDKAYTRMAEVGLLTSALGVGACNDLCSSRLCTHPHPIPLSGQKKEEVHPHGCVRWLFLFMQL